MIFVQFSEIRISKVLICFQTFGVLLFSAIAFVWPVNQSRNASVLLQPSRTTTLLWPTGVCSSSQVSGSADQPPKIFLLVIVCSAVKNFEERQVIRDTWAKDQLTLSNVKVIFLLGQLKNATFQSNVTTESENYGDILQEGFIDTYANLTVKSLMLLKWFSKECVKVPYILKTDDDMYINLKQLFQLVSGCKLCQGTKSPPERVLGLVHTTRIIVQIFGFSHHFATKVS